tara:strand:- start:39 stop:224 length:186 start_codon:yes stop_codon:yes gene_type:complete
MGKPGCPLLDLFTASTASILILFTQSDSNETDAATIVLIKVSWKYRNGCHQLILLKAKQTL